MIKKLAHMVGGRMYLLGLISAIVVGVYFRFYRLYDYATFLGDQGRDAIIFRRIVAFEHFPAIGAPTSVGAIFLGPFYYYFIAPWIALFAFDPVGPAYGVAFFSSVALIAQYFAVKDLFDKKTALISVMLSSTAWSLIEPSRFSWNPNLLAQGTFFATYFLVKCIQTGSKKWFVLLGLFSAIIVQLHYLALIALPIFALLIIGFNVPARKRGPAMIGSLLALATFILINIPLLIFDLRHDFLNSKNFVALFTTSSGIRKSGSLNEILNSFALLNSYVFQFSFSHIINTSMLIALAISPLIVAKKRNPIVIVIAVFLTLLIGASLYQGTRHPHYFNSIYLLYLVIIAYFLSQLTSKTIGWVAVMFFVVVFSINNYSQYVFVDNSPSFQIARAKKIARAIHSNVTGEKFTVTALPNQYSDATYRYFLEVWNKRATEKDSLEKTDVLFVVCEDECKPIGNPQWDIAYFAPTKIERTITVDTVTIYKLTK